MHKKSFDEAFKGYSVPSNIRMTSEEICKEFNINGICDPMYISNVIANELGLGDGCGNFNNNKPTLEKIEYLSKRLMESYRSNITDLSTVESIIKTNIIK
ncbi:MAG TPA: hypothetical protein GXX18_06200 [Bacillales bacterium]|nr:hypothetical protein [Bacillales bacterium]